ncbi:MAG: hypothetical protein JW954_00015 [Dehalococcoidaceae bacterium]|nr:hypothetical protein [Dehalococcoidaceae bacterium]
MKYKNWLIACVLAVILLAAGMSCSSRAETHTQPANSLTDSSENLTTTDQDWHLNEWVIHGIETRPTEALAGEEVDVWTNIYSANNDYSFASAFLIVNGHIIDGRNIIIPPDEDYPFLFSFTPGLPGKYDICVRVVCETKAECIDPFDTEAYLVDAFTTISVRA